MPEDKKRETLIVDTLVDAFADLMEHDAGAFRSKFRSMAADPWAFYRGSACIFYADMTETEDRWTDERTCRGLDPGRPAGAPASRRTTCSSRGTPRRWRTTSCSR